MDASILFGILFLFVFVLAACMMLYSLILQRKAVSRQSVAMDWQAQAMDSIKRGQELQEEIIAAQKETNALLRELIAEVRQK